MGSLFVIRPGHLRLPDLTQLPDGRFRLTTYQVFPAPAYVPPDYGALYDDTLAGDEATRYGGLRLINVDPGNAPYKPGVISLTLTYEQIHETNETQVGKLVTVTDENDREVLQAQFIQFSSAPYTKGTIGTTTPPGVATAVLDNETSADEGILRRITRRYVQAGAAEVQVGEDQVVIDENNRRKLERRFIQLSTAAYVEGTIGSVYNSIYALSGESKQESAAVRQIVRQYTEAGATFAPIGADEIDYELNGLKRRTRNLVAKAAVSFTATIGSSTHPTDTSLILASLSIRESSATTLVKATYIQPGIVAAEKRLDTDSGLMYVTFRSWGTKIIPTCLNGSITGDPVVVFQGGAAAKIFRDRVENVLGFKTYTVTVMMHLDGSSLAAGSDELINSYTKYVNYNRPGELYVEDTSDDPLAWALAGEPGATKSIPVLVEEYLSTVSTLSSGFKPFTVTRWATGYISVVKDGTPHVSSKSGDGYLGEHSGAGVSSGAVYTYGVSSQPTLTEFMALSNQVIASSNDPAFVTDEGVKWYKKTKMTVQGSFGTVLA